MARNSNIRRRSHWNGTITKLDGNQNRAPKPPSDSVQSIRLPLPGSSVGRAGIQFLWDVLWSLGSLFVLGNLVLVNIGVLASHGTLS
jgi:hypothetical protein